MNIRDMECWKELEPIFSPGFQDTTAGLTKISSSKFCEYETFIDRFKQSLARAERNKRFLLLLLLELKDTNSVTGQIAGRTSDLAVNRVGSCLRSSDTICKLGGGRLAILLEDIRDSSFVPLIVEKIHATLMDPFRTDACPVAIQPYSGAGLFPVDAPDCQRLWRQAKLALQRAVESTPGSFRFSPIVTGRAAMERFELTKDLYKAYRNNEFRMVYQPILNVVTGTVEGMEALLRWQHPVRGSLHPNTFLELLEESGLIVPVGERIFSEACLFVRKLLDSGHAPIRVCVNVSARQLEDSGFLLAVFDGLYDADIGPELLQLEFSEQALARNPDTAQRLLPELTNAGVRIAIDRFGIGEASIAELVRLPFSLIKLDRSLIEGVMDDPVSQAVTSGTFALATCTGMDVAAVGVEQDSQMTMLGEMGCKEIQGSLLSQPLDAGELLTWLPR